MYPWWVQILLIIGGFGIGLFFPRLAIFAAVAGVVNKVDIFVYAVMAGIGLRDILDSDSKCECVCRGDKE